MRNTSHTEHRELDGRMAGWSCEDYVFDRAEGLSVSSAALLDLEQTQSASSGSWLAPRTMKPPDLSSRSRSSNPRNLASSNRLLKLLKP